MPPDQATFRVPGTTSNLGPGFDCLGCAVDLHNEVTVTRAERERVGGGEGGGAHAQPHGNAFFAEAAHRFFQRARVPAFAFEVAIAGQVPRSRGLGSSATVRVGIMAALNALCDSPLDRDALFELCDALEGHPDNAAPTVYGGFNACLGTQRPIRVEVAPELRFVLLIPPFEISTPEARRALPAQLPYRDAVRSMAAAARITGAFALRDYTALAGAFTDYLHQPYREPLIPCLYPVIRAATEAGALGGFLSGSGSTIIALTLREEKAVAEAMLHACGTPGAYTLAVAADNQGCREVKEA
jgi:homoserine kinase